MCWEAWFCSTLTSLYPFFSWTLPLDMIPAHWEVCVLIQHLPLEFATYSPTLRLSWAGLCVPVRSEELEKAIGESKDANGPHLSTSPFSRAPRVAPGGCAALPSHNPQIHASTLLLASPPRKSSGGDPSSDASPSDRENWAPRPGGAPTTCPFGPT